MISAQAAQQKIINKKLRIYINRIPLSDFVSRIKLIQYIFVFRIFWKYNEVLANESNNKKRSCLFFKLNEKKKKRNLLSVSCFKAAA